MFNGELTSFLPVSEICSLFLAVNNIRYHLTFVFMLSVFLKNYCHPVLIQIALFFVDICVFAKLKLAARSWNQNRSE